MIRNKDVRDRVRQNTTLPDYSGLIRAEFRTSEITLLDSFPSSNIVGFQPLRPERYT
jgi:hypothetical protein